VFTRSADQQLFEETTKRFLDAECPPAKLRDLAGTKAGFEPSFWQQGAQLGWTSLAVPEAAGGGSVSGNRAADLALVAFQFGLHAAPGPLTAVNVVAAALGRWGTDDHRAGPLSGLLTGETTAAWALAEPAPGDGLGQIELKATTEGAGYVLDGVKTPVDGGAHADSFLVTARAAEGLTHFLIPVDAPGVTVTALHGLDMTRRCARLELDGVVAPASSIVGQPGSADASLPWLLDLAVITQVAEMCGAMTWAFDTTLDWAFNRYSFGRPLASYQEIKHRFADMKTWLEASLAIAASAVRAVDGDDPRERGALVSAAKFYVGRYGVELLQDCVQLHGGIGVTFDHDLHLFLRRVVTNAPLYGTPGQHATRLADLVVDDDTAAEVDR
jgi:alkylation response protein AidB-like acyl-CoA dehydrogenase